MHKNHNSALDSFGVTIYFPLIICNAISCPLCKMTTITVIKMNFNFIQLYSTIRRCVMHKNHNSALDIFGVIFPLTICNAISCPLYKLTTIKAIEMKLHTVVKRNKTMCHAQEP